MNANTRSALNAAVEFLNNDEARDLLGLHRIRVAGDLMTRGQVADMLQVALTTVTPDRSRMALNVAIRNVALEDAGMKSPAMGGGPLDDMPALIRQLAQALRQAAPSNDLPARALDYLQRHGLAGSPLR